MDGAIHRAAGPALSGRSLILSATDGVDDANQPAMCREIGGSSKPRGQVMMVESRKPEYDLTRFSLFSYLLILLVTPQYSEFMAVRRVDLLLVST